MEVTNLEIGYYQNEKAGTMICISTIIDSFLFLGTSIYKIEEEINGIYNTVLNNILLL